MKYGANIFRLTGHLLQLLAMLGFFLAAMPAYAEDPEQAEPGPIQCTMEEGGEDCNCRNEFSGDLLAVIVPCIREEVIKATERITEEFSAYMQPIIMAFLTLIIALFGVKVLMAEGDPKKDTFILLVKIGAVMLFTTGFGGYITDIFAIQKEGMEISTAILGQDSEHCQEYENEARSTGSGAEPERPWVYFDCILAEFFGFGAANYVGASIISMIGPSLVSGQFGMVFFLGATATLFFVLKLIIRGTYTYLMAVFALAFLIIISPILIPLVWLPVPQTQQYFDRWLNAFISVVILPTVVMGYLTLAFTLLEKIAYHEEFGIFSDENLSTDTIKDMRMPRSQCDSSRLFQDTLQAFEAVGTAMTGADLEELQHYDPDRPNMSGTAQTNPLCRFYFFDFRSEEATKAHKMFFGFIALLLTTYLLLAMLSQLVQMTQMMLGGGFFMDSAISNNPLERGLDAVQGETAKAVKAAGSQGAGQALVSGMSRLPGAVAEAMGNQVTRR